MRLSTIGGYDDYDDDGDDDPQIEMEGDWI